MVKLAVISADAETRRQLTDYVSVPKSNRYVLPQFRGRADERMILLRRDAARLASGGEIDLDRGYITGGDRGCASLPEGTLPLSASEIKTVRRRYS